MTIDGFFKGLKKVTLRTAIIAGVVGIVGVTAVNSYTITQDGTVKVPQLFGKYEVDNVLTAGAHFPVNPLKDFTTVSEQVQEVSINQMMIPTQDRETSWGNVTVQYEFVGSKAGYLLRDYGTTANFVNLMIKTPLEAALKAEGRKLIDTKELAKSDRIQNMQQSVLDLLRASVNKSATGMVRINNVLISDIKFSNRITSMIAKASERREAEEVEKSQLKIAETIAQRAVKQAEADAKVAVQNRLAQQEKSDAAAYGVRETAKAEAQAIELRAKAKLVAKEAEAKGNIAIGKSYSQGLQHVLDAEIQKQWAKSWRGAVPNTIMGASSKDMQSVIPLYHMQATANK